MSIQKDTVLSVTDLTVEFEVEKVWRKAVDTVSFTVASGEVLAIVGESGSGKSTTAMAVPGLLADNSRVSGSIKLGEKELVGLPEKQLAPIRGKNVAVIFQEPMTALNPVYSIGWQITEAIRAHTSLSKKEAKARAVELLKLVEMPDPETRVNFYPHQLSGGQRQRAMIAQALSSDPSLLIADEPTTALDVTIQAQILDLLRDLQAELGMAMILITHDLGVVAGMADRVNVMYAGRIVEEGPTEAIFAAPRMPYTMGLLQSVPRLDRPEDARLVPIPGLPPAGSAGEGRCSFAPRCVYVGDPCRRAAPALREVGPGHRAACWFDPAAPALEATEAAR